MRVRPNLALFTFASATVLSGCERRTPASTDANAQTPAPVNPVARGVDAPPPAAPAAAQ